MYLYYIIIYYAYGNPNDFIIILYLGTRCFRLFYTTVYYYIDAIHRSHSLLRQNVAKETIPMFFVWLSYTYNSQRI